MKAMLRTALVFCLSLALTCAWAQETLPRLKYVETAPENLLASKAIVLYRSGMSLSDLNQYQSGFQQIGIDAVAYIEEQRVLAGTDPAKAYAAYLTSRDIKFLIVLGKTSSGNFEFIATPFNNKATFADIDQVAWRVTNRKVDELLKIVYRDSWLSQKKKNFLINDQVETEITVPIIAGRRSELFPIDLKIDNLAIPKLADASLQQQMEALFTELYPYNTKYKVAAIPDDEKELRKQGFQYVLMYVHCSGTVARELLGYDPAKASSAYGSVTYAGSTAQLKTISAETPVYKFYFKHIPSGNVFVGTKWDADETFIDALRNHIQGFRTELKLN